MASVSVVIRDFRSQIPGKLTDDKKTWEFPTIDSVNSHGKKTIWKIYVRLFESGKPNEFIKIDDKFFDSNQIPHLAWTNVDSGLVDGKIRETVPTITSIGKNIGKKNETNSFTQALRDALGLYNKQLKKSIKGPTKSTGQVDMYPPMLAQLLKDQKTPPKIDDENSAHVQRKYNGVRTVTCIDPENNIIMYSRRKNIYPGFDYIKDELKDVLKMFFEDGKNIYLDGEIFKMGTALQDISGCARREDKQCDEKFDYMIYDCFIPSEPNLLYIERKKILDDIFSEFKFTYTKSVETWEVNSKEEIDALYKKFIAEGYEGAMVRTNTAYRYSYNEYHSKNLLKIKPTMDHEFKIVGWTTGEKGKAANSLMIICETSTGEKFNVTPAMEISERESLAKKMSEIESNNLDHFTNHWLGKNIIVEFDEYDKNQKIPQRARTRLIQRTWE